MHAGVSASGSIILVRSRAPRQDHLLAKCHDNGQPLSSLPPRDLLTHVFHIASACRLRINTSALTDRQY